MSPARLPCPHPAAAGAPLLGWQQHLQLLTLVWCPLAPALIIGVNAALVYNNGNLEQPLCHFSSTNIALGVIPISCSVQMEPGGRGRLLPNIPTFPTGPIWVLLCQPQVTEPHNSSGRMGELPSVFCAPLICSTSLPSSKPSFFPHLVD